MYSLHQGSKRKICPKKGDKKPLAQLLKLAVNTGDMRKDLVEKVERLDKPLDFVALFAFFSSFFSNFFRCLFHVLLFFLPKSIYAQTHVSYSIVRSLF